MQFDPLLITVDSEDNEDDLNLNSDSDEQLAFSLPFEDEPKNQLPDSNWDGSFDDDEKSSSESESDEIQLEEEDTLKVKSVSVPQRQEIPDFFENDETIAESFQKTDFASLSISRPIMKAISKIGWKQPTQIQSRAIPLGLRGRDICASAQTGSGKTAAFMIPVLERLLFRSRQKAVTRVLVLVPTRELGSQVLDVTKSLSEFSDVMISLCVGGLPVRTQEQELRKNPDIVIATPGRLIDHIHNSPSFSLDQIEILIMDEADRMLEDGFAAELEEIIKNTPKKRQTMLFSATMTDNVDRLISLSLVRPVRLHVDNNQTIADKLVQEFIRVRGHREEARPAILAALCTRTYTEQTIIFFRSKAQAHQMKVIFGVLGLSADELHGNLSQPQRLESLRRFRNRESKYLLCTDLASRGLDIDGIKTVINYDMPSTYQVYVHRVGRTARAEKGGRAVSLVGEQGRQILKLAVENSHEPVKHRIIPSSVIQKFEALISAKENEIREILQNEKQDKEISEMEMQVTKAQNILEHEDEIKARPKREWFQTEKERQEQKQKSYSIVDINNISSGTNSIQIKDQKTKRGPLDGLSRRKKRLRQGRIEDKKELSSQKVAAKHHKMANRAQKIYSAGGKLASASSKGKPPKKGKNSNVFSDEIRKRNK